MRSAYVAWIRRQHRPQPLGGDVLDVRVAGGDRRDLARVDVDRDDVLAGLRERDRQRQPDVSEPDLLRLDIVSADDSGAGAIARQIALHIGLARAIRGARIPAGPC